MSRTVPRPTALAIALGLSLSGCADEEAGPSAVPEIHLQEVQRFGSFEGDGSALSSVRALELTDSTVLILESSPARVAVFDLDGHWLRDVGRAGEGPGELRSPAEIGLIGSDVWIGSARRARVEVLSDAGHSIASHRWDIPEDTVREAAYPGAVLADGSILAAPRGTMDPSPKRHAYYRASPDGEVHDLMLEVDLPDGDTFTLRWGTGLVMGLHPLHRTPVVERLPNGEGILSITNVEAQSSDSAAFRVERITLAGRSIIDVRYQPVSADGWFDAYSRVVEQSQLERGEVDRGYIAALREVLGPRRFYPAVTAATPGTDGSIWIRREQLIAADSVTWDVYGESGELRARFRAPAGFRILRASMEEVWTVETNELDVPFVVRNEVTW